MKNVVCGQSMQPDLRSFVHFGTAIYLNCSLFSFCFVMTISAGGNGAFDGATRLLVAMTFGMGILVLAYAAGHHSGGQINCAVTLSLVLGGQVPWFQGVVSLTPKPSFDALSINVDLT